MNKNHFLRTAASIWYEGDRDANFVKYLYSLYHVPERELKRVLVELCHLRHLDDEAERERWMNKKKLHTFVESNDWLIKIITTLKGKKQTR